MVTSIHCLIQTSPQSIYYGPTNKGNNLDRLYGINKDPALFNPNTYVSHIKTHIEPTHKLSAPHNINYITSSTLHCILNKIRPKEQNLMVSQAGFSNLFLLQSVNPCRPSQQLHQAGIFPAQWRNIILHPTKK